jgi:hypothetical protein
MKAFVIDRYQSKGALRFGEIPNPQLRDDDVMVQICAASANPGPPDPRFARDQGSSWMIEQVLRVLSSSGQMARNWARLPH